MGQEKDYVGSRYGNGHHSSEELKRQVDHTRAEMDETIDALIARLDPAAMLSRAVRGVMSSGGKRAGSVAGKTSRKAGSALADVGETVFEKAKENPIPTALIGLGVAWMVMSRDHDDDRYEFFEEYDEDGNVTVMRRKAGHMMGGAGSGISSGAKSAASGIGSGMRSAGAGMKSAGSSIKSGAGRFGSSAKAAGHSAKAGMGAAASSLKSGVSQSASATKHGAGVAAHTMSDIAHDTAEGIRYSRRQIGRGAVRGAQRSREGYEVAMRRAPLAVGGIALGLGLLAGLLIPETRREDEMFGETRDDLFEHGKDMAKDYVHRGQEMAKAAAESTTSSLKKEGLTPSGLAEKGQRVAQSAREAAEKQLHEEHVGPHDIKEKIERTAQEASHAASEEAKGHKDTDKPQSAKPQSDKPTQL